MENLEILVNGDLFSIAGDGPFLVGRSLAATVRVADPRVSRQHAIIRRVGGRWYLSDRSSGGTWLDGRRVDHLELATEVILRLGATGAPEVTIRPGTGRRPARSFFSE